MRNRADRHRARQRRKRQGTEEFRKRNRPGRWETRVGSEDVRNGDERFRARVRRSCERAVPVRGEDERFIQRNRNRVAKAPEAKVVEEKFKKMVANAKGEDNGEGFIITDEHGNVGGSGGSGAILNAKCPITGLPLKDLEDPVEDAIGIVYEASGVDVFRERR